MADRLRTSYAADLIIEKVHDLLGLKQRYYAIARLAISLATQFGDDNLPLEDINGKDFRATLLLNKETNYDLLADATIALRYPKLVSSYEFYGNDSVIKRLIDFGCKILEIIYKDSNGDRYQFLKKLYSLKYDEVYIKALKKALHAKEIELGNNRQTNIEKNHDSLAAKPETANLNQKASLGEESYIYEMLKKIQEFLGNLKFDILDTTFDLSPAVLRIKVKIPTNSPTLSKVTSRIDDLKLQLGINDDPIIQPISGFLCFDVPRKEREMVYLKDIIDRVDYSSTVKFPIGINTDSDVTCIDLSNSNTPHLLIAGATGQGKSECLKSIISSLIINNSSDVLEIALIDPKMSEFTRFKKLPHLRGEVITEIEDAVGLLSDLTDEMNRRYRQFNELEVNDITKYNKIADDKLKRIVVFFDEFADYMLDDDKELKNAVEKSIKKLSAKARASGIHLVLSTQRPDRNIMEGVIKSNIPAKISLKTSTPQDSQIIIGKPDAYRLFGKGDMLLSKEGAFTRIQGAFISDAEMNDVINRAIRKKT